MNCSSCGANLAPGTTACPLCGTPAPYNAPGSFGNPQQIDPTVAAGPQYDYRGTPSPSTAYGAQSYGPPPQNQYNPASPYGSPTEQYPPYMAPQPPNQYGLPQQQPGFGQPGMYGGMQPPPPKKRSRVGLIIGVIIGVIALLAIGVCAIVYTAGKSAVNTVNTAATTIAATATASTNVTPTVNVTPTINLTPTLGQGVAPSGLSIDPTAAGYVTHPEMSSAVDSNFHPTTATNTFTTGQTIYATFQIASSAPEGYVTAKWYSNGSYAFTSKALAIKGGFVGYLAARYNQASLGTVEYYYCTTQACSDAKLANVLNFAVTATGMHSIAQPVAALTDLHKRDSEGI